MKPNDRPSEMKGRTPVAWVLCTDERQYRFFEIELAHLGLEAVSERPTECAPILAVIDTDVHPAKEWESVLPADCPVVAVGYTPCQIPPERGIWLRRPVPLRTLEITLRRLSAEAVSTASPLAPVRADRLPPPPAEAALIPDDAHTAVVIGDRRILLTPAEWAIFSHLYAHRGEAVSRAVLDSLLGGGGNSVEVYICHLRRKIEKPLGRRLIRTVRGVGYCLD